MENQEWHFLNQLERQESLHKAQMEALLSAADKTNTVAFTSLFAGRYAEFCAIGSVIGALDRLLGEILCVC